jgi:hypothetical protein
MSLLAAIFQIIIAVVIFNVWVLRRDRPTPYRPDGASNLREEFQAYGLPDWARVAVGAAKLTLASALVIGLFFEPVALVSAALMAALMLGAVAAHLKVQDPLIKAMPAFVLFILSSVIVAAQVV